MKKSLPIALATALIGAIPAAALQTEPVAKADRVAVSHGVVKAKSDVKTTVLPGAHSVMRTVGKRSVKSLRVTPELKSISPIMNRALRKAAAGELPAGLSFYENFEGAVADDAAWLPEGWSVVSNGDPSLGASEKWCIYKSDPAFMEAYEGNYMMMINFASVQQDEYLIMPKITVKENEQLKFSILETPLFFYQTWSEDGDVIDWGAMKWVVDPQQNGDITVEVRRNGGEWAKVWSMMDQYPAKAGDDITGIMSIGDFFERTVSLDEFAGEEIEIAFHCKALDCNTTAIDVVSVGLPSVDGISYMMPLNTLYWGFDRSEGWSSMNNIFTLNPVNTPIEFTNMSDIDGATYSWAYHDPETNDWGVSNAQDMLSVTYRPDYTSEFTCRNNLYYAPVLNASAPGASDGSFTINSPYIQAGGRADFVSNGIEYNFGLLPFNINETDYGFTLIDDENIGDPAIPVFGHNVNTNKYWLWWRFNGETPDPDSDVQLDAILNFLCAPSAPLVIEGLHLLATGKIQNNPEFKAEIIPLSEEFTPIEGTVLASATCKYDKFVVYEGSGTNDLFNICFDFAEPFVLDDTYQAYFVRISGFNCDDVTFFAPLQSLLPDPNYLCFGYVETRNKILSDDYRLSYTPLAYVEGEYGDCYNAFAIHIDGCYPWLDCDVDEINVAADGTPVTVSLGSYYDGADLKISAPAGIEASVSGRYGNCVLTVKHDDTEVIAQGDLTVSAPGVSKTIKIAQGAGISDVTPDSGKEIKAVYTVDGRQVNQTEATRGFYIIRYTDGTSSRTLLK